jgi:hypothetical protein
VRAAVLTVLRTNPLDYTSLVARLEQPLEKPLREWVETFNSHDHGRHRRRSFFKADFSIALPRAGRAAPSSRVW